MTNTEIIQAIKAEIERRMLELSRDKYIDLHDTLCRTKELHLLLSFLDTLESEKPVPNVLEQAADEMALRAFPEKKSYSTVIDRVVDYNAVDRKNYRDGITAGAKWQKEQMLKEAVEGAIVDAGFDDHTALVSIPDKRYDAGDKVRIIVIPNTDEK